MIMEVNFKATNIKKFENIYCKCVQYNISQYLDNLKSINEIFKFIIANERNMSFFLISRGKL